LQQQDRQQDRSTTGIIDRSTTGESIKGLIATTGSTTGSIATTEAEMEGMLLL
jgi:hypothetical protein